MSSILFSLPIIILLSLMALLFLRRQSYTRLYYEGVRDGIKMLYGLFPALLVLCIFVKLISACGIIEDIALLLSKSGASEYVDARLIPLILTRPVSGSASSAILSDLASRYGADSQTVFTAAVIISSSDTCIYIHSTYFSCISPKKSGTLMILMLVVSLISCIAAVLISKAAF